MTTSSIPSSGLTLLNTFEHIERRARAADERNGADELAEGTAEGTRLRALTNG